MTPSDPSSAADPGSDPRRLHLRLFVAGDAPNSVRARANITSLCDQHFAGGYDLEIVDLFEHPQRALADGIVVTPTLLKLSPLPRQRAIGNLADVEQVLRALGAT